MADILMTDKDNKQRYKGSAAFYTVKMLEDIPKDLLDIFTPTSKDGLAQFELNILMWLDKAKEREKIMQLQKYHNLPLRPNQSLRDVMIAVRIAELKKKKFKDKGGENYSEGGSGV